MTENLIGKVVRIKSNDQACPTGITRVALQFHAGNSIETMGIGWHVSVRFLEIEPTNITLIERITSFFKLLGWVQL